MREKYWDKEARETVEQEMNMKHILTVPAKTAGLVLAYALKKREVDMN